MAQNKTILISFLIAAFFMGCSTREKVSDFNVAGNYNYNSQFLHPDFKVFNFSGDSSRVYFQINSEELLYTFDESKGYYEANVLLRLEVTNLNGTYADSTSARLTDQGGFENPSLLIASLDLKIPAGDQYQLKMNVIDIHRKVGVRDQYHLNRKSSRGRENFLAYNPATDVPSFSPYYSEGQAVALKSSLETDTLICHYFKRDFPLPPPPFTNYTPKSFDYSPDQEMKLTRNGDGDFIFHISSPGFYHVQTDTSLKEGITIYLFDRNFPEVTTVPQLLEPMRYLMSYDEYNKISSSGNIKTAIEEYWIKASGSKDKARDNIQKFYERVTHANYFYSSYVEGWRTDRGMIYLIYGKPNIVYRKDFGEVWIYGEENNPGSLQFSFIKVLNPFTANDYRLHRDEIYKPSWYRVVDSWRSGRAITN